MLISADQEEGEVTRIGSPATVFPGNMALGATRAAKLTRRAARITGEELRAMGVNVDNAPVVDVNINPLNESDGVRSFGDRNPFVSNFGAAAVKGYRTKLRSTGVGGHGQALPGPRRRRHRPRRRRRLLAADDRPGAAGRTTPRWKRRSAPRPTR